MILQIDISNTFSYMVILTKRVVISQPIGFVDIEHPNHDVSSTKPSTGLNRCHTMIQAIGRVSSNIGLYLGVVRSLSLFILTKTTLIAHTIYLFIDVDDML